MNEQRNILSKVRISVGWSWWMRDTAAWQDLYISVEMERTLYRRNLFGEFRAYAVRSFEYTLPGYSSSAVRLWAATQRGRGEYIGIERVCRVRGEKSAVEMWKRGPGLGLSLFNKDC